tara:strand:- start:6231 stop:7478 length:1248 start_codon:yes stop_codon:yes gene_type:complete
LPVGKLPWVGETIVKTVLAVLVVMALGGGVARAQDDPLPQSVARAYLAYEDALVAGDDEAALQAAEAAWRAAREERIDAELIGILAENYGNLALSQGQAEAAYPAWRDAAQISDRLRAPAQERASRWYRASLSAFADERLYDARQCSLNASRAAEASDQPIDPALSGEVHYMIAATSGQLGRLNTMAEHAILAVEGFQSAGRPYDRIYANAHYLSGVGRFFEDEATRSILDFHMARGIYATIESDDQESNLRTSSLWIVLARDNADAAELAEIDAQIADSDFPDSGFENMWDVEEVAGVYDVDATPARRRREPRYPEGAAMGGLDGLVMVRFDITAQGRPDNIEIVAAAPGGVFDQAVTRAMRSWQYEPAIIDGEPVRREGVLTRFAFTMCDLPTRQACRLQQEALAAAEAEEDD